MSEINTIDYLADTKVHMFNEDMSIIEATMETCLLAETNWAYTVDIIAEAEYESYEAAINEGMISEDALAEADSANKKGFIERLKEGVKKVFSYISGIFAKFINWVKDVFSKFGKLKENKDKIIKGAEEAEKKQNSVKGYLLTEDIVTFANNAFNESYNAIISIIMTKRSKKYYADYDPSEFENGIRKIFVKKDISDADFKDTLTNTIGKESDWKITKKLVFAAIDRFDERTLTSSKIKDIYKTNKDMLNKIIDSLDKTDETDEKIGKLMTVGLKVTTKANGIILNAIKMDISTTRNIIEISSQNAINNVRKDREKEESKQESASYISESIESIYGLPV